MTKFAILSSVAAMLGVLLHAGAAGATGPTLARTWVSGTIGSDSNACTRAAPCATFAHAISQTIAGGEIDVLDGGEFGPVIINQAITIANDGSGTAAITPANGNNDGGADPNNVGVIVAPGATDAVVLRGLSINGVNAGSAAFGIADGGGSLVVDHCTIQGFQLGGIQLEPGSFINGSNAKLVVKDTVLSNDGSGGAALGIQPLGFTTTASLQRVQILNSIGNGIRADATNGGVDVELHDVTVDAASGGAGVVAVSPTSGGPAANILADHVTVAHGPGYGFKASGGTASVYLRGSVSESNGVGLGVSAGGQIFSYDDNSFANNTGGAGVTPTAIPPE